MLSLAFQHASFPATPLAFQPVSVRCVGAERVVVTFHQSYSYEDFVEGLRPVSDADGNVRYEVKDGVFKRLCRRAQQDVATNERIGHE